jgi:hypothetical protein
MSFPILIQRDNGQFTASLLGAPEIQVAAPTRDGAVSKMQAELERRYSAGDIVFLDVPARKGAMAIAGKYRNDPTLEEIRDEIYRQRDAEPKE